MSCANRPRRRAVAVTVLLMGIHHGLMAQADSDHVSGGSPPPDGFKALFNGMDLAGWWGAGTEDPNSYLNLTAGEFELKKEASLSDIHNHWRVEHGELVNDGEGLFLTTDEFYADFELLLEYKTVPLADSGVYLRGCPQVQIWDPTEESKFKLGADKGSGGLWNNSPGAPGKDPLVKADNPFGAWNHMRIIMVGSRVWVWLNHQATVAGSPLENYYDRGHPVPPRGPIQLQTHGGEIRWRNIHLREISSEEAIRRLRGEDPAGFKRVFNGENLEGWQGAVEGFIADQGILRCKPDRGGTIYLPQNLTNFAVRLEFKLPPGGNNGLALRYPGTGDPAYTGMCESQILDDHYESVTGKVIDPRQAHGSAYGMAPAHRGYQHPTGDWNYQEVRVKGSGITVDLNGTRILACDLDDITDFMGGTAHPGKDLESGYFGFAGHHDAVMFRNISIQPLP